MIFEISHKTHYRYTQPVVESQHVVRVTPRALPKQSLRHHSLLVEPAPSMRVQRVDAFGNSMVCLSIEEPHQELVFHARSGVETRPAASFDATVTTAWDHLDEALMPHLAETAMDVFQYRCGSRLASPSLEIADFAAASFPAGRPLVDGAIDLTHRIFREFKFDPTATDVSTPVGTVLRLGRGVCQDFAHLSLAALRSRRIPARYVSGYILTRPPPGQARLQGADASHAWISVWAPETGWVDLDPTNGLIVGEEHVTVAYGRDYDDVSPISGVLLGGGKHVVSVGIDVIEAGSAARS